MNNNNFWILEPKKLSAYEEDEYERPMYRHKNYDKQNVNYEINAPYDAPLFIQNKNGNSNKVKQLIPPIYNQMPSYNNYQAPYASYGYGAGNGGYGGGYNSGNGGYGGGYNSGNGGYGGAYGMPQYGPVYNGYSQPIGAGVYGQNQMPQYPTSYGSMYSPIQYIGAGSYGSSPMPQYAPVGAGYSPSNPLISIGSYGSELLGAH